MVRENNHLNYILKEGLSIVNEFLLMAKGMNKRFPEGNTPFQIVTRILEECGEVASEVNLWEDTGVKRQKRGEPKKEDLANEIRQSIVALMQLAVYYNVEKELEERIEKSLSSMRREGFIE
jgi:NTP pyrophosphatase (non-canonical NTP hydrolase)